MKNYSRFARIIRTSTLIRIAIRGTLALTVSCTIAIPSYAATVIGDSAKWSPITLDFIGVSAKETDTSPNPFLDYRLTVKLFAPSGRTITVPGFFAGDGNGFGEGNHWQARFAADEVGTWKYEGIFQTGSNIAIDLNIANGTKVPLEVSTGTFDVVAQSEDAPGFLKHGRLQYVGKHYMKFQDGPYWIKAGTDSPENILGYAGFDGTKDYKGDFLHTFEKHIKDAESTDPMFSNASTGVDGRGLTGALNYLSEQGINSIYFLPMNLGGDGWDTYPFVAGTKTSFNKTHYDISKLHQWNLVLDHAQRRGIALNIVLSETERDNERWLDDGKLGTERKLYFRELVARFGYLMAAKWNLGEENDFPVSELRLHADYIRALDWSEKPIAVHTHINDFSDYEEIVGEKRFSATSIQYRQQYAGEFVEKWRKLSTEAGHPWILDMDENTTGLNPKEVSKLRKQMLYDVLFSGGQIEWYFGYHDQPLGGDITAGDFRQREEMWVSTTIARKFMEQELPFWRMDPNDSLISGEDSTYGGAEVFAAENEVYAIYLPDAGGNPKLDLSDTTGNFVMQWFNPTTGEFEGQSRTLASNQKHSLGAAPSRKGDDWVILVRSTTATKPDTNWYINTQQNNNTTTPDNVASDTNPPNNDEADNQEDEKLANNEVITDVNNKEISDENNDLEANNAAEQAINSLPEFHFEQIADAVVGQNYRTTFVASDSDGIAPVVTADTLPSGISIKQIYDGVFEISGFITESHGDKITIELIAIDTRFRDLKVTETISIPVKTAAPSTIEDSVQEVIPEEQGLDHPPIILGVQNLRVTVGQAVSIIIVPVDIDGVVPNLRLMDLPEGASFEDNGNGTRTFRWTPQEQHKGFTELKFVATDAGETPHVVQEIGSIEVVSKTDNLENGNGYQDYKTPNFPPIFRTIEGRSVSLGETVSFRIAAIDPEGIAPIMHLLNPPEGSSFFDNGDGTRTFSWTANGTKNQTINLEFTAVDSDDYSITNSTIVQVTLK